MRNRTEAQVTLAFIRHGETKANREHRYLGRTDEALSEEGRSSLLEYKKNGYPNVKYLFSSPMKRCLETAEILYPDLRPRIIPEWEEMDFGRFEYKNYGQLKEDAQYQAWIDSGGTLPFPEGESREQFCLRCEAGFIKMCGELRRAMERDTQRTSRIPCPSDCGLRPIRDTREPADAALIVHGGTIMALLSRYCGKNYFDYQVPNGRGYVCRMRGWDEEAQIVEAGKL